MTDNEQKFIITLDDDADFNILLKKQLEKFNFKVQTTSSPKEFLAEIKAKMPDIVIVDLNLSLNKNFGEGFQVIKAIRNKLGNELPIMALSRRSDSKDIASVLEMGADDFVPKPLDIDLLVTKITKVFKGSDGLEAVDFEFPHKLIPAADRDATIALNLKLIEVNEFGLTLHADYFISKGHSFDLEGDIIEEIFDVECINLSSSIATPNKEIGGFNIFSEFPSENLALISSVRKWMTKKEIELSS